MCLYIKFKTSNKLLTYCNFDFYEIKYLKQVATTHIKQLWLASIFYIGFLLLMSLTIFPYIWQHTKLKK